MEYLKDKRKKIYYSSVYEAYRHYLLYRLTICNHILRKFVIYDEYKFNIFNLKIFLHDYKNIFENMKKTILINDIKNYIFSLYDEIIIKDKDFFDAYIRNWMDDYLNSKHIKTIFDEIEKENSSFIKYFKFLKVNCSILYYLIQKLYAFSLKVNSFNIKFTFNLEKDIKKSLKNMNNSLIKFSNNIFNSYNNENGILPIINYIKTNEYYFNEPINTFI